MKCPQCGKKIKNPKLPSRPFCSNRCKLLDLGQWLSGEYRIAAVETEADEEEKQMTQKETVEE
jgi:endogenous inhibitor of DNA gyrase (YacG/DUF329 family)